MKICFFPYKHMSPRTTRLASVEKLARVIENPENLSLK